MQRRCTPIVGLNRAMPVTGNAFPLANIVGTSEGLSIEKIDCEDRSVGVERVPAVVLAADRGLEARANLARFARVNLTAVTCFF